MRISDWSSDVCSSDLLLVAALGPDILALLADHDGGAGVLAARQDHAGRDIGVLQQFERDEMVVRRGLLVVEDGAQLGQMAGPEQMRNIMHRREGEIAERLRRNLQHLAPARSEEHTSELQSLMRLSYAVFCLKKKNKKPSDKT